MLNNKSEKNNSEIKIGIGSLAFVCILLGFIIYILTDYALSLIEQKDFSFLNLVLH